MTESHCQVVDCSTIWTRSADSRWYQQAQTARAGSNCVFPSLCSAAAPQVSNTAARAALRLRPSCCTAPGPLAHFSGGPSQCESERRRNALCNRCHGLLRPRFFVSRAFCESTARMVPHRLKSLVWTSNHVIALKTCNLRVPRTGPLQCCHKLYFLSNAYPAGELEAVFAKQAR